VTTINGNNTLIAHFFSPLSSNPAGNNSSKDAQTYYQSTASTNKYKKTKKIILSDLRTPSGNFTPTTTVLKCSNSLVKFNVFHAK